MLAGRAKVRQYVIELIAGQFVNLRIPAAPTRIRITLQNTGTNPAVYRWAPKVLLDGGDIVLATNDIDSYFDPCPIDGLSFYSDLGTTIAVIEGNEI